VSHKVLPQRLDKRPFLLVELLTVTKIEFWFSHSILFSAAKISATVLVKITTNQVDTFERFIGSTTWHEIIITP